MVAPTECGGRCRARHSISGIPLPSFFLLASRARSPRRLRAHYVTASFHPLPFQNGVVSHNRCPLLAVEDLEELPLSISARCSSVTSPVLGLNGVHMTSAPRYLAQGRLTAYNTKISIAPRGPCGTYTHA